MCNWGDFLTTLVGSQQEDNPNPNNSEIPSVNDFDKIIIGELPQGMIYSTRTYEEESVLIVDPEYADDVNWEASKSALREAHAEIGGFSTESLHPFVSAYREGSAKEYVDNICEFYEGKVPPRFFNMIEESMFLRIAVEHQNLSLSEVRHRKEQISKHGDEAFAIASLCSSGYLDEGGIFWEMYEDMVIHGRKTVEDYKEIFVNIASNKPFVVFVKVEDTPTEVYDKAIGKASRLRNYDRDFEFIDIRGTGEKNHRTIEESLEILEDYHENLEYEKFMEDRDLVIRFDTDSLR